MSGKPIRRLIVLGALAALLLAGSPAWAGTREAGPAGSPWQWLTNLWKSGVTLLWSEVSTPPPGEGTDQGPGTDPNGGRGSVTSGTDSDQGPGTDPNGRP